MHCRPEDIIMLPRSQASRLHMYARKNKRGSIFPFMRVKGECYQKALCITPSSRFKDVPPLKFHYV